MTEYARDVDWDSLDDAGRGELRGEQADAAYMLYWLAGAGMLSGREGDESARRTAELLMRERGWTVEQLNWWARNRAKLPTPEEQKERKKALGSKGRFKGGAANLREVNAFRLERQFAAPEIPSPEEASRICGEIRGMLMGMVGPPTPHGERRLQIDPDDTWER